ncbi:acetyl-CoA synthetase-like protein [Cadophora sp. DSE1049]|nr:acetyl-CoA synthetase-like protein [Cadophora sp. DSE1049]
MPIRSSRPDIEVPKEVTIWSWLFESPHSAVNESSNNVKGFRDPESGKFISFTDVKTLSTHISTSFSRDFQVGPGDCISIFCNNSLWYPIVLFAAFRIGAAVAGASSGYTSNEMAYAMQKASPKVILVDQASFQNAYKAIDTVHLPRKCLIFMDRAISGYSSVSALIDSEKRRGSSQVPKWTLRGGQTNANTCALLCFSSGTTGLPKAVRISHENVIAQCCQMKSLRVSGPVGVLLSPLPLFHITGLVQIMIFPVHINQEVIIMARFNMKNMLDAVVKYRSEELWLVPPILIRLINDPLVQQYNLKHIKQFNTGAAPLSPEVIQKLAKKFPAVGIKQGWGMTESTSCITSTPPEFLDYKYAHTVGVVVPNTTLKIIDPESGEEVGVNVPGEILAKGPQISMGYKDNPKATKETYDDDGYLHTGDLGSINEKGLVTIHDRIKELIKVRGTGVAPAELEGILIGHPLVQDAAVTAIRDDYSGELPKAFIVLQDDVPRTAKTADLLKEFVKRNCARAKWLDGGVVFLDAIPKSASGKILRRVLRDGEVVQKGGGGGARL